MSRARPLATASFGAVVAFICTAASAADLGMRAGAGTDPFLPTRPVGVASELPRSPLADVPVFGTERFATSAEAQARCPRDSVVRVEALSDMRHPVRAPGSGAFMCRSAALSEGDLPR